MQGVAMAVFEDSLDPASAALAAAAALGREAAAAAAAAAARSPKEGTSVRDDGGDGESDPQVEGASLLALRLAREARGTERVLNLLACVMQEPPLALQIGALAGIPATFHYGASARDHGLTMREVLPKLYTSALPQLYVCGGASLFRGVLRAVSRFDAAAGTWQALPPMATARRLCAAAAVGSSLYVMGGEYEEVPLWYNDNIWARYRQVRSVERFEAFSGTWHDVEDMPTARAGCAGAAQNGLVYALGGRIAENVRASVERLDTALGRWERLPNFPTARSGCAAASLLGMLYVLGGKGADGQILASVERFDPSRGWWQVLPAMPTPRSACACGVLGGRLFVAGGFNGMDGLETVDAFDARSGRWEAQPPMQTRRIGAASAVAGGKLYVLGGKTGGDFSLLCERLDPAVGAWEWLPPMLERHVYCAGVAVIGCS